MEYLTIWVLIGKVWLIERSHTADYCKVLLGDKLEKEIKGHLYKAFNFGINPNEQK